MFASSEYEGVIGLEVHAELQTESKMFCACPVVDATQAEPNIAVCPVCSGMPGVLPVVNRRAVEYALRVALGLECQIANTSIFARKNYFYPDLPKGYQISQYEEPLAVNGRLEIQTSAGAKVVRIRRVHLEEDTGKLTHIRPESGDAYSLVDLNRAGVPLLEIVSEPDLRSAEEARAYGMALRALLRSLGVNSGDMEKGVIRFEANISIRPRGSEELWTRVEVKNLNSFRAMERAIEYELARQADLARRGERVRQETLGWDEARGVTFSQRSKEEAEDYRYFPEPDLPPLVVSDAWVEQVCAALPELPQARLRRFQADYGLSAYDASLLTLDEAVSAYYETALRAADGLSPKLLANWIIGEMFAQLNQAGAWFDRSPVPPEALVDLLRHLDRGDINMPTTKTVLAEMFATGRKAGEIIDAQGLHQVSDSDHIATLVRQALTANPTELASYLNGKESLSNWFFGQVMRSAGGKANPQVVRAELARQLQAAKDSNG